MAEHISQNKELNLYEGDQSSLYSGLYNHHKDEGVESAGSKSKVKKIWRVTGVLSVITIVEVIIGIMAEDASGAIKAMRNIIFLLLTLVKAGYIVSVFMHLGDERKTFRKAILAPLVLFVWFIIAFLIDGNYWKEMNELFIGVWHQLIG